tara:strand:- start:2669 stop:3268 length:600 start_codon:yes stop_codon:yes gene_type:complete
MAFITNITTTPVVNTYGADGKPLYVDNRQGNIRGGGTVVDTGDWSASTFGEGNPVTTIVSGVNGVVSANQSASINAGTQVISVAQTTIAGIANTTLQGGQSNSANDAYTPLQADVVKTYYYKTAVVAGNWNIFNGTFSSISNADSGAYNINGAVDNAGTMRGSGTDVSANPSQAYPGILTYRDGSPNPTNDFYQARNNW